MYEGADQNLVRPRMLCMLPVLRVVCRRALTEIVRLLQVKSVRNMLNHLTQDEKELVKRAAMEGGTCRWPNACSSPVETTANIANSSMCSSVDFLENLQTEVEGVASKFIKKIDTVATVHALLGKNVLRPDATISVSASDGLPPLHFRSRLVQVRPMLCPSPVEVRCKM